MHNDILTTELLDSRSKPVDQLSDKDALIWMLNNQAESFNALKGQLNEIEIAVGQIYKHLKKSTLGRIIYCGAGTSARIGVQDGTELFPTFGWPKKRVGFIVAGGKSSIFEAIENAEDNSEKVLNSILDGPVVNYNDVLIALAASGNTPFTCQVVQEANKLGALTLGISNNLHSKLLNLSNLQIFLDTGPEVVAGSTRLKAGTSQKVCLNLISTLLMSKMGRIKNGYMSHMVATNKKLRQRKNKINKLLSQ